MSWQALTGANAFIIADTANHKDLKSTQIYARLNRSAVRESMTKATETMTGIKVEDQTEAVVETPQKVKSSFKLPPKRKTHEYRFGIGINERGEKVPVPEEVKIIRDILRMREIGLSLGEIAASLNSQGRLRRGRHWLKSHDDWVFRNRPKYLAPLLEP